MHAYARLPSKAALIRQACQGTPRSGNNEIPTPLGVDRRGGLGSGARIGMRYCVVHTRELHQPQQMVSRRSAHTGMPSLALARAEERYTSSSLDVAVLVMQASGVRRSQWTMCSNASVLRCEERAHCTARLRPEGGSVLVAQAHAALEAIRPLDEGHACAKATTLVTAVSGCARSYRQGAPLRKASGSCSADISSPR